MAPTSAESSAVRVLRVADKQELCERAALSFIATVAAAQRAHDYATVVLTGGSAGIGMLEEVRRLHELSLLQQEAFPTDVIDFDRVHFFFGDERNVPVEHPESNEGQARAALLNHVNVPEAHIHSMRLGEGALDQACTEYAAVIERFAPASRGFDLHLLGMGGEGHINSLFPHTEATACVEATVLPVYDSPKPPAERGTLTLPMVARAKRVWLLVAGAEKATAAKAVVDAADPAQWPAAGAHGSEETVLFVDTAAAAQL